MQAIKNKLKSKRGASISFGLMLFLVCAVASSIIIVAATAASGRMAQIAEMDQRYYAVTSAVELLCNDIGGQEIEVIVNPQDGTVDSTEHEGTIIEDASDNLIGAMYENNSLLVGEPDEVVMKRSYTLSATVSPAIENISLDCTVKEVLMRNGLLYFYVTNGTTGVPNYTLRVIFASNIKETALYSEDSVSTTLSWKLHSIKKMRTDSPGYAEELGRAGFSV